MYSYLEHKHWTFIEIHQMVCEMGGMVKNIVTTQASLLFPCYWHAHGHVTPYDDLTLDTLIHAFTPYAYITY